MSEDKKAQERTELAEAAKRGRRTEEFLKSDFWLLDLEPHLAKEQAAAVQGRHWSPASKKSLDEAGLLLAYLSGVDDSLGRIEVNIRDMITRGEEASQELARMEKQK